MRNLYPLLLALVLTVGCSKSERLFKEKIPEQSVDIRTIWEQSIRHYKMEPGKCSVFALPEFPCVSKRIKKWVSELNSLRWKRNPKPNAQFKVNGENFTVTTPKGIWRLRVSRADENFIHVISKYIKGDKTTEKAGYIAAADFSKLFPDLKNFRNTRVKLPQKTDSITYRHKTTTRELDNNQKSLVLKMLSEMKVTNYPFSGLVRPRNLKAAGIDQIVNNFPGGSFHFKGEGRSWVYRLGRPHETKPLARVWLEGEREILEVEFRRWGELEKLMRSLQSQ